MVTTLRTISLAMALTVAASAASIAFGTADAADPNRFNRLMRPPSERNLPPARDGIQRIR